MKHRWSMHGIFLPCLIIWSFFISNAYAIDPPSVVQASKGTYTNYVQVAWLPVSGANYYYVYRCMYPNTVDPGTCYQPFVVSGSTTSYIDADVPVPPVPLKTYYYRVRSVDIIWGAPVLSHWSDYDYGWADMEQPVVNASDGTSTLHVEVTWNAIPGAQAYDIYRGTASNGSDLEPVGRATSLTFNDETAQSFQRYYYWVRGVNVEYTAGPFNTTLSSGWRNRYGSVPTASQGTSSARVEVQWDAVSGATHYELWRNTARQSVGRTLIYSGTRTNYHDYSATPLRTYYYQTVARNESMTSRMGGWGDGYRSMGTPSSVSASPGTYTDRLYVSWSSVSGATGYEVWRDVNSDFSRPQYLGTHSRTYYNDFSTDHLRTYFYKIKAKNGYGAGEFSYYTSGYRGMEKVIGVNATDGDYADKVSVTWQSVPGATMYQVWRSLANDISSSILLSDSSFLFGMVYMDSSVRKGVEYSYWVVPRNSYGQGEKSLSDTGYAGSLFPWNLFLPTIIFNAQK